MLGDGSNAKLSSISADVLHCAGVIVAVEFGEFRHLELRWQRQLVIHLRIRLRVRNDAPLWSDSKLVPQIFDQLILEIPYS